MTIRIPSDCLSHAVLGLLRRTWVRLCLRMVPIPFGVVLLVSTQVSCSPAATDTPSTEAAKPQAGNVSPAEKPVVTFDGERFPGEIHYRNLVELAILPLRLQMRDAILRTFHQALDQAWRGVPPLVDEFSQTNRRAFWNPWTQEHPDQIMSGLIDRHLRLEERFVLASRQAEQGATRLLEPQEIAIRTALQYALLKAGIPAAELADAPFGAARKGSVETARILQDVGMAAGRSARNTAYTAGGFTALGCSLVLARNAQGVTLSLCLGAMVGKNVLDWRLPEASLAVGANSYTQLVELETTLTSHLDRTLAEKWPEMVNQVVETVHDGILTLDGITLRPAPSSNN